ncbi:uncharacterized protein DC041_0007650 [Schistosoma bovis]|uniref:Uncharacterized protein n=1 Tax=Schistosoma bovis TaxID=6184 RepID=A0A430QDM5_SCHBO|nr:uncharacterized protein DC041_0007650 [Schistosoma bovis]
MMCSAKVADVIPAVVAWSLILLPVRCNLLLVYICSSCYPSFLCVMLSNENNFHGPWLFSFRFGYFTTLTHCYRIITLSLVGVSFIPVFGLTSFHVYLISRGMTTNEQVSYFSIFPLIVLHVFLSF